MKKHIERMAKVLVDYSLNIKKGDYFVIEADVSALPLVREIYKLGIKKQAFVEVFYKDVELQETLYKYGSLSTIKTEPQIYKASQIKGTKFLNIAGKERYGAVENATPEKIKAYLTARKNIRNEYLKLVRAGKLDWCITTFPIEYYAKRAGMTLKQYTDFLFKTSFCSYSNPVKKWKELSKKQQKIVNVLNKKSVFQIITPKTNLTVSAKGRKWLNCDGRLNFPDGEICTSPIENSAEGVAHFDIKRGIFSGILDKVTLEFKKGKVIKAKAKTGQKLLDTILNTDKGARYLGEIAMGTNPFVTKQTQLMLLDEKMGGTFHLAIGNTLGGTGGKNKSNVHCDLLMKMDKGKILADGKVIYEKGRFVI
jgi:aminopeptidase